mgnify:CR=1 FL=1
MAQPQTFGVPDIKGNTVDELRLSTTFWMQQIYNHLDKLAGLRGNPTFFSNLDVQGNRIQNVPTPIEAGDAVPKREAITKSFDPKAGLRQWDAEGLQVFNLAPGVSTMQGVNIDQLEQARIEAVASSAPIDAEYVVAATHANLSAERVATDTVSITWDFSTAAQAKANVAHITTGTFTITGTGFTVNPTGTARWIKDTLSNFVCLFIPELTGTSNATTFTLTGLPADVTPTRQAFQYAFGQDAGINTRVLIRLNAASTTIDLFTADGAAWTAAMTKTLSPVYVSYHLN